MLLIPNAPFLYSLWVNGLNVPYYMETLPYRDTLCFVCYLRLGLLMCYLWDQFFVIIFIMINHIISLKQTHLFFWTFLPKFQPQSAA